MSIIGLIIIKCPAENSLKRQLKREKKKLNVVLIIFIDLFI